MQEVIANEQRRMWEASAPAGAEPPGPKRQRVSINLEAETVDIPGRTSPPGEASRSTGEVGVDAASEPPTPSNVEELADDEETRRIFEAEPDTIYTEAPPPSVQYTVISG